MIELCLTPDDVAAQYFTKHGVVLFIINTEGELLVTREKTNKPETQKVAGDISVVCETSEPDEAWPDTLLRGMREELGLTDDQIMANFVMDPDTCFAGEALFLDDVLARVVIVGFTGNLQELSTHNGDGEIEIVGWRPPTELDQSTLRTGVQRILNACLESWLFEDGGKSAESQSVPLSLANLAQVKIKS